MKKLKDDFKRMLNGLAYQNAGDFLSRKEKIKILDSHSIKQNVKMPVTSITDAQKQSPVDSNDEVSKTQQLEQTAA